MMARAGGLSSWWPLRHLQQSLAQACMPLHAEKCITRSRSSTCAAPDPCRSLVRAVAQSGGTPVLRSSLVWWVWVRGCVWKGACARIWWAVASGCTIVYQPVSLPTWQGSLKQQQVEHSQALYKACPPPGTGHPGPAHRQCFAQPYSPLQPWPCHTHPSEPLFPPSTLALSHPPL